VRLQPPQCLSLQHACGRKSEACISLSTSQLLQSDHALADFIFGYMQRTRGRAGRAAVLSSSHAALRTYKGALRSPSGGCPHPAPPGVPTAGHRACRRASTAASRTASAARMRPSSPRSASACSAAAPRPAAASRARVSASCRPPGGRVRRTPVAAFLLVHRRSEQALCQQPNISLSPSALAVPRPPPSRVLGAGPSRLCTRICQKLSVLPVRLVRADSTSAGRGLEECRSASREHGSAPARGARQPRGRRPPRAAHRRPRS